MKELEAACNCNKQAKIIDDGNSKLGVSTYPISTFVPQTAVNNAQFVQPKPDIPWNVALPVGFPLIPVTVCPQTNEDDNSSVASAMAAAGNPGVTSGGPVFNFYFGPE